MQKLQKFAEILLNKLMEVFACVAHARSTAQPKPGSASVPERIDYFVKLLSPHFVGIMAGLKRKAEVYERYPGLAHLESAILVAYAAHDVKVTFTFVDTQILDVVHNNRIEDEFVFVDTELASVRALPQKIRAFCNIATSTGAVSADEVRKELKTLDEDLLLRVEDVNLHYVFAGLVNAGKSTLLNSIMINMFKDARGRAFPEDLKLMRFDLTECTSAVACVHPRPAAAEVSWCIHTVRTTLNGQTGEQQVTKDKTAEQRVRDVVAFDRLLDGLTDQLKASDVGGTTLEARVTSHLKRLQLNLPYKLNLEESAPVSAPGLLNSLAFTRARSFFFGRADQDPKDPEAEDAEDVPLDFASEPVFVDTPGIDSPEMLQHLMSILQEKSFMLCFLVPLDHGNPFGDRGFEVLKFVGDQLQLSMPPVIVFTKWEMHRENFTNRKWMKKEGYPDKNQYLQKMMRLVFTKLTAAGVKQIPFFAVVDARTACQAPEDGDDEEELQELQNARRDLKYFVRHVTHLGNRIALPLHLGRVLAVLSRQTQRLVNIILKDEDSARLLTRRAMQTFSDVAKGVNDDFKLKVDNYFKDIPWSQPDRLKSFKPPVPFSASNCAIHELPKVFSDVFERFQADHPDQQDMYEAVEKVVLEATTKAFVDITQNLTVYEQESIQELTHAVQQQGFAVNCRDQIARMIDQRGVADRWFGRVSAITGTAVMIGGAAMYIGGLAGLVGTATAGSAAVSGVGVAALIGSAAMGGPLVALGAAWAFRHNTGLWNWSGCRRNAKQIFMQNLKDNVDRIKEMVKDHFTQTLEKIVDDVENYRLPLDSRPDTRAAQGILKTITEIKQRADTQVAEVLQDSGRNRWVGDTSNETEATSEVRKAWEAAMTEFQPHFHSSSILSCSLHMRGPLH